MNTLAKSITDFFRSLLENKVFKNNAELQRFLGIAENNPAVISRFISGESNVGYQRVCEWLEKMGCSIVFPHENLRDLASYRFVPKVAAVAGAGATLETSDEVLGYYAFRADWMGAEHVSERQSVLMDVRGDSMEPLLKDGDTVLVDQSDTAVMDGRIYVVTLGDELRVKRLQKTLRGYVLRSENSRYADIIIEGNDLDALKIHGRVRWVGKML